MTTAGQASWNAYEPSDNAAWNLRRGHHLHRRAGFGATWDELQRDLAAGPEASINRLLAGGVAADDFDSLQSLIGDAAVASGDINRLKAWWIYRMLFSGDPVIEQMTLLWHNHFATSNLKVNDVPAMKRQNDLLREHAVASYGQLLPHAIKDPAMLIWLDANSNRREHPNENLARELMELFSVGVGNYDEHDVQSAARALTGWTIRRGQFAHVDAYHDDSDKRFMGRSGKLAGDDVLDALLDQPATAHRLAKRLCNLFFGEDAISADAVSQLGEDLHEHQLDVRWAVETILRSDAFFADNNISNRVTSPVQFVIGQLRILEMLEPPPSTLLLAEWTAKLGQDLFHPPNVFGWPGGRSWLTSRTMIGRINFASAIMSGRLHRPARPLDTMALARRHGFASGGSSRSFFTQLLLGQERPPPQLTDASSLDAFVLGLLSSPEAQIH